MAVLHVQVPHRRELLLHKQEAAQALALEKPHWHKLIWLKLLVHMLCGTSCFFCWDRVYLLCPLCREFQAYIAARLPPLAAGKDTDRSQTHKSIFSQVSFEKLDIIEQLSLKLYKTQLNHPKMMIKRNCMLQICIQTTINENTKKNYNKNVDKRGKTMRRAKAQS